MIKQFIKATPFGLSILLLTLAVGFIVLIAPIGGNKALIVRSGSMQPAIGVGDLITVKPQETYKAGDIIAFKDPLKSSVIVTHRITGQKIQNDQILYQTKGDTNEEADFSLVPKENVIGRADISIRGVGKLLAFTKTRDGFLALAIGPAILVILLEINNIIKEVRKGKKSSAVIPAKAGIQIANLVQDDIRRVQHDIRTDLKKVKSLYEHYGKPMGLPHPNASFRSLFYIILRAKSRSHLKNYYNFSGKFSTSSNNTSIIFRSIFPIMAAFLLIGNTFSFFSDTETSTGNTFQASETFPHVVINEVYYNPEDPHRLPGHTEEKSEWVELYNPTSQAISLAGWSITDNHECDVLPGSPSIPANSFAILSPATEVELRSVWTIPSGILFVANSDSKIGNGLRNNGDRLTLKSGGCDGSTVDQMSYGDDPYFFTLTPVHSDHSWERNPDGIDTNTAADFVDRTTPTPGT